MFYTSKSQVFVYNTGLKTEDNKIILQNYKSLILTQFIDNPLMI